MRADLEDTYQRLSTALQLADQARSVLRDDDRALDAEDRLLHAIASLGEVLGSVARERPDLEPEPSPIPREISLAYGALLVEALRDCEGLAPEAALQKTEHFLARDDLPALIRDQATALKDSLHRRIRLAAHPEPSSVCGVILTTDDPMRLARFYTSALGVVFEREEHDGLSAHYGADVGETHVGLHPPESFAQASDERRPAVAFAVDELEPYLERLETLGAKVVLPPHDEGFGRTTTYADPDGNLLELVELSYDFDPSED